PGSMTLSTGQADTVTSSRQPIYVWRDFVGNALRGRSAPAGFPVPEGIEFRNIDLVTGRAGGVRAAFASGSQANDAVTPPSSLRIQVAIDTRTNTRATASTPADVIEYREVAPEELYRYL